MLAAIVAGAFLGPAHAEDAAADSAAAAAGEEDETKALLSKLTITMISDVIDERTVMIRDASGKGRKKTIHLRLGNSESAAKGDDAAEKSRVATEALKKMVDKQMIWYKAAPEDKQPAASDKDTPDVVIADLWTHEGKHISTALKKEGHLTHVDHYEEELAKDILTAAAEVEKKESYKKLEEALKESEAAKKAAAKAAKGEQQAEEEAQEVEGLGVAGWMGIAVLGTLVVGVATNFGRPTSKKVNLNKKKPTGFFGSLMSKLKGA